MEKIKINHSLDAVTITANTLTECGNIMEKNPSQMQMLFFKIAIKVAHAHAGLVAFATSPRRAHV